MLVADIILEQTAYSFDKPFGYKIPESLKTTLKPGCRVVVPFGRGNQHRQGMVFSIQNAEDDVEYKQIASVIDDEPVVSDEMLKMCSWMHEHCFCTYFDAIKAVLPAGIGFTVNEVFSLGERPLEEEFEPLREFLLKVKTATRVELLDAFDFLNDDIIKRLTREEKLIKGSNAVRRMTDSTAKFVRFLSSSDELDAITLTSRQAEVAKVISDIGTASVKEVMYFTGASLSVINTLEKKGVIETFEKEVYRSPIKQIDAENIKEINLTDEQTAAYKKLSELYASQKGEVALLYGVTGSGKTSVFLKIVDKAVADGKGVIIMVPEISLTPQTVEIFGKRYGKKIALFHSAMSLGQRMDEWKRVAKGEATIAIGTRSAVFAPVKNLALIIMDEEQEHTYKSEKSPRFHARDLAKFRTAYNNSLLVLASATPSLESYTSAKIGKYSLCTLSRRYGNALLPEVKTIDMRRELMSGNAGALSAELKKSIDEALRAEQQAIVLLNRRGHNTYISCPSCGYVALCPNCSVSMTYHSANGRVMCHYCGHSEAIGKKCPSCSNADLRFMGLGTQRVEQELKATFPEASVLRLDADSTSSRDSYSEYLTDFAQGKYDIMIGTQMVAKGLNFPNVTVVGVIGADSALNSSDYRSFERSFSLLTQVLGRAGRGEDKGLAIIQTIDPQSNLIKLAEAQDYDSFYNQEINIRRMLTYPPYCDIAQVTVTSASYDKAQKVATDIFKNITDGIKQDFFDLKMRILGPSPAVCPKVNNKYRYRLIIKAKNSKNFRLLLKKATAIKTDRQTSVTVDINPETII